MKIDFVDWAQKIDSSKIAPFLNQNFRFGEHISEIRLPEAYARDIVEKESNL